MTASQKALLLAQEYPEADQKGKRTDLLKKSTGDDDDAAASEPEFDRGLLSRARKIVKWAPELITGVMGGAVKLMKMATRIRDRAIRRAGELLKQIEPQKGGDRKSDEYQTAGTGPLMSRKEAGEAAGMSKRQAVTAIRVANVPAADFEKQVESPNPPTVGMPPLTRKGVQGAGLARSADS